MPLEKRYDELAPCFKNLADRFRASFHGSSVPTPPARASLTRFGSRLACRSLINMHDLIGDIHGHADALQQLLTSLGYSRQKGVYRHPERRAIFLGDFIDRGPQIRETLEIVRPMVDAGSALAVMGNHELNALAFHTPNPDEPGCHLRPHNEKNSNQHAETMRQVPAGELASYLSWFRTLPMWLDLDRLRVVHACWDETQVGKIGGPVTDEFLHSACRKGPPSMSRSRSC